MSTMLLSIKPKYANVILQGEKEYEFRKKRCRDGVTKIVFYSSSPQKQQKYGRLPNTQLASLGRPSMIITVGDIPLWLIS